MAGLFWHKKPYDIPGTEQLFMKKIRENMEFHFKNCSEYQKLLERKGWNVEKIRRLDSAAEIPFLPTLYFKHHKMDSVLPEKMMTRATSSGTSGNKSDIGYDFKSLWRALGMSIHIGRKHKLFSARPCHYIILGYESRGLLSRKVEEKAVAKTAYAFTFFAPALSRTYALRYIDGEYVLNLEGIKQALLKYSKGKTPVRLMGFPFHAYFLLTQLQKEGIQCHLPKGSMVAFGGGWKEYYTQKADKETMYKLIEEVLGIPSTQCYEFFGAAEHPILYTTCARHHFHVPIYSRVLIRDVDTFEPVDFGKPGLVNLITPLVNSAPLLSVMTDDLGILYDGRQCGCGVETPYLEILGRVGMEGITTCAVGAEKLVKQMMSEDLQ